MKSSCRLIKMKLIRIAVSARGNRCRISCLSLRNFAASSARRNEAFTKGVQPYKLATKRHGIVKDPFIARNWQVQTRNSYLFAKRLNECSRSQKGVRIVE